jgi:hypothetical protein
VCQNPILIEGIRRWKIIVLTDILTRTLSPGIDYGKHLPANQARKKLAPYLLDMLICIQVNELGLARKLDWPDDKEVTDEDWVLLEDKRVLENYHLRSVLGKRLRDGDDIGPGLPNLMSLTF